MNLLPETHAIQSQLAAYTRDGKPRQIPGVRSDRVGQYRRLIYNVFDDTLRTAYPVTHQILSQQEWNAVVADFMENHDARFAQIWKMPYEFYEFALQQNYAQKYDRPWLEELLYFEWIEIEVHTMPDADIPKHNKEGDVLNDRLVLNPESRLLHFNYPVHNTRADQLSENKGDYFVLVYREGESGRVRFFEMTLYLALIIEQLLATVLTGQQAALQAAELIGLPVTNEVTQDLLPFFNDLILQGIILGFQQR